MLGNWIKQSTTTTGTGNLTLSPVSGYPLISSQFDVDERASYSILDSTGLPIEMGKGYLNSTGEWVRALVNATMVSGVYTESSATSVDLPAGTKYIVISTNNLSCLVSKPSIFNAGLKLYGPASAFGAGSTLTLTANRAYAVPFIAAVDSEIDAIYFRVTTAGAASTQAVCAIYSYGADGLPGVQLALGSTVLVDSTGNKICTFTRFRPPPVFFVCLLSNGAPVITAYAGSILGSETMGADASMGLVSFIHHVSAPSLTFPTTWTAVTNASNATRPHLMLRCV